MASFEISFGGTGGDSGRSIALDDEGNVYVIGNFLNSVDFDPGPGTEIHNSQGGTDTYVAKFDAAGEFLWVNEIGGPGEAEGNTIALDSSGGIYATGFFDGTIDFDPGPGTATLTGTGGGDSFVVKLDDGGAYQWAQQSGGGALEVGTWITTDSAGNVFTSAWNAPGWSSSGRDALVSKLDTNGTQIWANAIAGPGYDSVNEVAVGPDGFVYTSGVFEGTTDFDPGAGTSFLTSAGGRDAFVTKSDADGNLIWARRFGGTGNDTGGEIAIGEDGNVVLTGNFTGTVDLAPGTGTGTVTSFSGADAFAVKLDADGTFLWGKQIGSSGSAGGNAIDTDAAGNVYVAGSFSGTLDANPGPGAENLVSAGGGDGYITKLDANGEFVWAKQLGGTGNDSFTDLVVDSSFNVHVSGSFQNTVDLDLSDTVSLATSNGGSDAFVVKFEQAAPLPTMSVSDTTVTEGTGGGPTILTFAVTLSATATTDVTVEYATVAASASAGSDFVPISGSVTIAAGDTSGTIEVSVIHDAIPETDESLALELTNPVGAAFEGGVSSITATGIIMDDDIVVGGTGDDSLRGDSADNWIIGGGGQDTIKGALGDDTLDGGAGNDFVTGGRGNDGLLGGSGDDTLRGNQGSDTLSGGNGADQLRGGQNDDLLFGGSGNDDVRGNQGLDTILGGDGDDTVRGNQGADLLSGGNGDDNLHGGQDADQLYGASGNDYIAGGRGNDSLFGDSGNDTLRGNQGSDTLSSGNGDDQLRGGRDADLLVGGLGNDDLNGNQGNDTVSGGDGADRVRGGQGDDLLLGGAGADTVIGNQGNDTLDAGAGDNSVHGGQGDDLLIFNGDAGRSDFNGGGGTDILRLDLSPAQLADPTIQSDLVRLDAHISGGGRGSFSFDGIDLTIRRIEGYELAGGSIAIDDTVVIDKPSGGGGGFVASSQALGASNTQDVGLVDLDGDGDLDAYVANRTGEADEVWLNDGTGQFTQSSQSLSAGSSHGVDLADLDGDGDADAFIAKFFDPANQVWLNDGSGSFTDTGQRLGGRNSTTVRLGDLDGDGDADAFITNFSNAGNTVWLNDGSGSFTDTGQSLGNSQSIGAELADLDGDGDLDAFVANGAGNANRVWLNDGSGGFVSNGQAIAGPESKYVDLGDVDGDGDIDAYVVNQGQANRLYLNDGSGQFTDSGQSMGNGTSIEVALGDLDGDGDLDAYVANTGHDNRVWLNDGSGVFTDSGQSLGSASSFAVSLGDVDGDADLDAFVGNFNGEAEQVWLNGAASFTPTEIQASDLLGNDIGDSGATLTIHSVSGAVNGSVALNGEGSVVFTPDAGFSGQGSFDYMATDGSGGVSNTATVSVFDQDAWALL